MTLHSEPHFIIKANLQKSKQTGVRFSDQLSESILCDVCERITGQRDFTYDYVDNAYSDEFLGSTYNMGRLALLHYKGRVAYISFSEPTVGGRNSAVQSVPTAFNLYYNSPAPKKSLYYYFLNQSGNGETSYLLLMYRLMRTVGFIFLNAAEQLAQQIHPFVSIDDIISVRRINTAKNSGNNSTYITKSQYNVIDIYGKTYGANKYETSMFCYAASVLADKNDTINLYEIIEGDLRVLPAASLDVINKMGNISVYPTDITMERTDYEQHNSLRSPRFLFNLLSLTGKKRCALCGCTIPEIVQAAHIWPVSMIKKASGLSSDEKLACAFDGCNGIWLCENHHKLFDENLIGLTSDGMVTYRQDIEQNYLNYIDDFTKYTQLTAEYLSERFIFYLARRNATQGSTMCILN